MHPLTIDARAGIPSQTASPESALSNPSATSELSAAKARPLKAKLRPSKPRHSGQGMVSNVGLSDLMEALPAAVYTCDVKGRITLYNAAAATLWGREPKVGHDVWCGSWRIYRTDGAPLAIDQCPMAIAIREGRPVRGEEILVERPDGTRSWVLPYPDPLRDNAGNLIGGVNMLVDLTQLRETERALRQAEVSKQLLAAIVESSDDAIASKDLNGIITSWNRGAERLFGYSAAEVIGRPVTVLIPTDHADEEIEILRRLRRGERIDHYKTIRRRKDGSLVNVSLTVSPVRDAQGKVMGASKIARDITQQREAEERLEQTVTERTLKLRETVAELEAFSYSIAHDMRAPLRAMQSFSLLLQEDYGERLDPQGHDYIRRIATSADRLDRLIQDVLDYSKIARAELRLEVVDAQKLLGEILESYPHLQEPGATVQVQFPIPPVLANTAALTQCLSNLLSNAVKFVAPGTKPHVRLWATTDSDGVRLWFEDNGIGISEEGQGRIFSMFQRLNPTNEFEGTGIGLTIVRKAVERMGGRVGVESELGKGSRFWLQLRSGDQ